MLIYKKNNQEKNCISRQLRFLITFKPQNYSLSAQKIKYGLQLRYNNLISPLTTLYGNLWHQSLYYVSYMTLYEIQEIFSTSMENKNYTVFSL